MPIETDPTYQAYLRAIGLQKEQARAGATQQQQQLEQQLGLQLPEIAFQGGLSRENIGEGYEGRGSFMSGARMEDQARQRHSEEFQTNQAKQSTADQIAQIQQQLATQLAGLDQQQAEKALSVLLQQQAQQQAPPPPPQVIYYPPPPPPYEEPAPAPPPPPPAAKPPTQDKPKNIGGGKGVY